LDLTQAQQVTTAESSRTRVRPPGAGLLTWLTITGSGQSRLADLSVHRLREQVCAL